MRRKLHRPVVGGRRSGGGFRWGFGSGGRDFWAWWDRGWDRGIGGRVLSSDGGARLVLRASSGEGTMRPALRSLPLRSLRTAPTTPIRHHPPDIPRRSITGLSTSRSSPSVPILIRSHSFYLRQPNVSWKGRRRRRFQKAWRDPQRKQHRSDPKERQPSLRPPDPDTHPPLSPGAENVSPKAFERAAHPPAFGQHSPAPG